MSLRDDLPRLHARRHHQYSFGGATRCPSRCAPQRTIESPVHAIERMPADDESARGFRACSLF
jgi:hypothetical protein